MNEPWSKSRMTSINLKGWGQGVERKEECVGLNGKISVLNYMLGKKTNNLPSGV